VLLALLGSFRGGGDVEIDVALVDERGAGVHKDRVRREGVRAEVLVELLGREWKTSSRPLSPTKAMAKGFWATVASMVPSLMPFSVS